MKPHKRMMEELLSQVRYRSTPELRQRIYAHIGIAWQKWQHKSVETGTQPNEAMPRVAHAALDNSTSTSRVITTRCLGRIIMKSPIAKLTMAAAVVVAALLGIHFSGGTSTIAWAAVLEKVNGFDTCVFRTRDVKTTGPRPDGFEFATESESRNYRSDVYGRFSEKYKNGRVEVRHYMLLQEGQLVSIGGYDTPHPLCLRAPVTEGHLRAFRNEDPRRMIAKMLAGNYVELGEDVIEGKRVRGVELRDPGVLAPEGETIPPLDDFASRFWIDVETKLPVWMEMSIVLKGSPTRMTTIWDHFEWGVPLEASLFRPEIPPGCEVVDDNGSVPDSTPKTDAAEAFAQNTIAEPYLGDFDRLPLPDVSGLSLLGVDPSAPKPQVRLLGGTEVTLAHDACVAKWPRYEQVQAQLHQELQEKIDIDAMDVNRLVTTGIALRKRFWELGGCLSDIAYPYIYAARLVDEVAHEQAPGNSAVTDQLIESIMAYEVMYYWEDPAPDQPKRNPIYGGLLADLRYQQYGVLKAKMGQGYMLTWKDFVRCCDLITLSRARKDDATALEVIRLLIDQAETAGWTYYLDELKRCEQSIVAGEGYLSPIIFIGGLGDVHLAQYERRLWSFQGPQEYRQSRLPTHLRHLKGW